MRELRCNEIKTDVNNFINVKYNMSRIFFVFICYDISCCFFYKKYIKVIAVSLSNFDFHYSKMSKNHH